MGYSIERYHDFCAGHRVVGHEGKCRHLHGHNYRVYFTVEPAGVSGCRAQIRQSLLSSGTLRGDELNTVIDHHKNPYELDNVGRVIDFSVVKAKLCQWLEDNWDHKFIAWDHDPMLRALHGADKIVGMGEDNRQQLEDSIVFVPFNPTAENMAQYLVNVVAPIQLYGTGCELTAVRIEETRKCSAIYKKD